MGKAVRRKLSTDNDGNLCMVPPFDALPKQYFLTSVGDGSGDIDLVGDYSAAAQDFYIEFPYHFSVKSLLISMALENKAELGVYGSIDVGELTNGVKFFIQFPGVAEVQLLAGLAFTCNCSWYRVTKDIELIPFEDTLKSARMFPVLIDLEKRYGCYLNVVPGTKFIVRLHDDFTGLLRHSFNIGGLEFVG